MKKVINKKEQTALGTINAQQAWQVFQQADCLVTSQQAETALDAMAGGITRLLADKDPILVCIMTGGVVPFGKLLPRLQFPFQIDYVHATRYGNRLHGEALEWISGPHKHPKGRVVLLVDDILDEGATLAAIEERYRRDGAVAIYKAVLVVKERTRTHDVKVDFAGLHVPDRYIFGYGMDYKGYLRNAPGIFAEAEGTKK